MRNRLSIGWRIGSALILGACIAAAPSAGPSAPLAIGSARVTLAGTSNIHEYTASTTTVRVTRAQIGAVTAGPEFWENALKPGAVESFEIAIPAATLTSPKADIDKNMHKALKTAEYPDITFRLVRFDRKDAGATRAIGMLRIAGVEREVGIDVTTARAGNTLVVKGVLDLLMTDYGIEAPKAMMGMLKTDPKVHITFEVAVATNLT
jgi:polyisoprenoid-binding protein YceI